MLKAGMNGILEKLKGKLLAKKRANRTEHTKQTQPPFK